MNTKNISKTLLIFLIFLISISFVSALSLVAEYEDGSTAKTIMPGESIDYYVFAVADQGLDNMQVKGQFFDVTTGDNIFIKTLFDETTTDLFFSEMYQIISEDYSNLPGEYKIKITAEEVLENGFQTSKVTYLDLEVFGNRPPVADFIYTPQNPTTATPVTFISTSYDDDGYLVRQEWFVGGVKIGEGQEIIHSFNQVGTYNIMLKVTDNDGATDTKSINLVVTNGGPTGYPVADFIYSPSNPVVSEQVTFTSTSYDTNIGGYIVLEEWDFNNDGIFETSGHIITRTFNQAGTYIVTLKVTDNSNLQALTTKQVVVRQGTPPVNIPPVADFIYSPAQPLVDQVITFNSTSYDVDGDVVLYVWIVDGVYVGNNEDMLHTFTQPGTYSVSLTVTDNDGATNTKTKKIMVKQGVSSNIPPVADFIYSPAQPLVDQAVIFTSTSYDVDGIIVSQSWYINGVFQGSGININKIFNNVGVYLIRLVVTDDDGATDSKVKLIIVRNSGVNKNVPPVADFTYLPVNPTPGDVVTFQSTSTDSDGIIVLEEWFIDGVLVSTNHVMSYTFEESRVYNIVLRVTDDDGATDSKSKAIRIGRDCRPNAVLIMPESVVMGTSVIMDGSESTPGCNASIIAYEWKIYRRGILVDTFVTNDAYKTYTFSSNAEYRIVLTVYTNTNKFDSDEKLLFAGRPHQDITIGQEDDLFVDYFYVIGEGMPYGVIECGEQFIVTATVTNDRDEDIEDLKITFAIPELGFELESGSFDLDSGDTETINFEGYLDLMREEVPPGEYIALIGASDSDTVRNKYFPLMIR
ncbi:MAG: PKD domain-containing protein [Candidatus Nanoarchaeia archaeon]